MASGRVVLRFNENCECKVLKVKVHESRNVETTTPIIYFEPLSAQNPQNSNSGQKNKASLLSNTPQVIKINEGGVVEKIFVKEGDVINFGSPIIEYSVCTHPTVVKDMCAECGSDLREKDVRNQTAEVAMVHTIPELMVSMKEAQSLGKADEERLLRDRKLVLLVDLDQTLIHTTNDDIPPNIEDVFHFKLHGSHSQWYHTRLRPFTRQFLQNVHALYELHICTFGSRTYAHTIAGLLDSESRYFSHRILSRDECFSAHSKTANLKALFPCGDHMVVIIDDREDVWNFAANLIHVRPYHFFQHTGDINAPPGLTKQEKDDKEGFDFTTMQNAVASQQDTETKKSDDSNLVSEEDNNGSNSSNNGIAEEKSISSDASSDQSTNNQMTSEIKVEDAHIKNTNEMEKNLNSSKTSEEHISSESGEVEKVSLETPSEKSIDDKEENDSSSTEMNKKQTESNSSEERKIHINDTDDYLLYLQEILRTVHHAYYEMYDSKKNENPSAAPPDMKKVLPYVRRKVLENVRIVFSGLIPTNAKPEKSRPYLVAKSLGAVIEDNVTENTTHVVAARLGTSKLIEAKNYRHIHIVRPDWLWTCAERWERVDERLYPLTSDTAPVRRKPPAHCSSPDVTLQLAMRGGKKADLEQESQAVYDRVTGKKIRKGVKLENKGLATSDDASESHFSETVNPLLFVSSDEIADMGREVEEDIMQDNDTDDGGIDEDEDASYQADQTEYDVEGQMDEDLDQRSSHKRKREETGHLLLIGYVSDPDDPDNDSLDAKFRRGEEIPVIDSEENGDEDENEPEIEDLEQDEEPEDSEWCLAGEALEREFLSEGD